MMMNVLRALFVVVALAAQCARAAHCHDRQPAFAPRNAFAVQSGAAQSVLHRTCANGHVYKVTVNTNGALNSTANSHYFVTHVYGTPYEWGVAQGTCLRDEATAFLDGVWHYLETQVDDVLKELPTWLATDIANFGLDAALDLTEDLTRAYTSPELYDEMRGVADGAGLDYQRLVRLHMIAGLTQGKCSMFGAWGDALDASSSCRLLQLRALDWNMDASFRNYSAITVYHPAPGSRYRAHVNVAFPGFVGSLTGVNDARLGISEIGVSYPDASFGKESRWGVPFVFLLRDVLREDYTVSDAVNRMVNSRRTCDLILGVGDGKLSRFVGMQYSYSVLNTFDDLNLRPANRTWHPLIDDVVYWGMDWDCPGDNFVLSRQLQATHGALTAELAIANTTAVEESGDTHIAFYDLTNLQIYVSFASQPDKTGPLPGYARPFVHWDAAAMMKESSVDVRVAHVDARTVTRPAGVYSSSQAQPGRALIV